MAKTINHPPYEIDPWKADVTEPPSELPFSPEIVEAVEKPKQEPVPPQSTEGQQKIEESISRVDRFNNEINSIREQQEQVLQEVQVGIDETSNKIKHLNELEERIKQQVADYTEDTDRFLREAGQLKGELEEAQGKMDKAITDASSAITAAESAQNALEAYKNGEKARLEEAIKEAQVGVAKADDVNKQIAELKNSLGGEIDKQIAANNTIKEIQSSNEALGSRLDDVLKISKKGVEDAAKAIELLNSNIDIGGSLIALVPGTSTPIWAEKLEKTEEVTPDGEEVYVANDNMSYQSATEKLVKASDKIEYMVSFWHKSSVPGSKMFVQLSFYDEKGDPVNAVKYRKDKTEKDDGSVHWNKSSQTYVISGLQGETEWTKHEYVIGLRPGTEFVFLNGLWWNHNSAPAKAAQYLGGFRIDPLIPSQADVDRAQNKAIEANSLALEQQKAINKANEEFKSLQTDFNSSQIKLNKTYNAMWDAQGKRNLLQEGIDKSQNDVIRSLARPQIGDSIIDYIDLTDDEIKKGVAQPTVPTWAANMTYVDPANASNQDWLKSAPYPDSVYRASSSSGPVRDCAKGGIAHPVNPDTEYRWSIWIKNDYDDASFYITLCDENGNPDIIESGSNSSGNPKRMAIISNLGDKNKWTKYSGTFRFKRGTRFARVRSIDSNYSSKNYGWLWYSNLIVEPNIPSQADVDKAQNEAIKANTLALKNQKSINDKQNGIAAAHAKAIESNRKAIRALAKIELGGSLLAYMPLTDEEIDKGLTREYLPAWAANATNVVDGSESSETTSSGGYDFLGGEEGGAIGEEVYARVSPGTQYLLDISISSPHGVLMPLKIRLKTSSKKVSYPIELLTFMEEDEYGGLTAIGREEYPYYIHTVPGRERERVLVKFKDYVEDICVSKISWDSQDSITVNSFSLAPYVPSQAAINARQYKSSAGVIHLNKDRSAVSLVHGVGFQMPGFDKEFKIYSRTESNSNFTVLVSYGKGLTGGLVTYRVTNADLKSASDPSKNIKNQFIINRLFTENNGYVHQDYKYYHLTVDSGDVKSTVVLVDHADWIEV